MRRSMTASPEKRMRSSWGTQAETQNTMSMTITSPAAANALQKGAQSATADGTLGSAPQVSVTWPPFV